MLKTIYKLFSNQNVGISEFERNNPLGFGGERVDFLYDENFDFSKLDMYQKNHFRRYEFAFKNIEEGEICGDFACGSGYGSIIISNKASKVIGIDLNRKVISTIKKRYKKNQKVDFINQNLLEIEYANYFSSIISFETIEHFKEDDINNILILFNKSLKSKGRLIFSTPYLQEDCEAARTLGFHKTFNINEEKIKTWLIQANFENPVFYYQDYSTHEISELKNKPDFIICIANKI